MNRATAVILLVSAALGVFALTSYRGRVDWMAPDFALEDMDGNAVRLSSFRGKVVFLNIWTTWCEPCRLEMPSMEALHRDLRDPGFVMLAVNTDADGREAVEPFVKEFGLTFPVLLDPDGEVASRYGVTGYPETFIVDRNGRVAAHEIGPRDWSDAAVERALRRMIAAGVLEMPS